GSLEPLRDLRARTAPSRMDQAPGVQRTRPEAHGLGEPGERAPFPEEASGDHREVATDAADAAATPDRHVGVLDPHQETISDGSAVDLRGKRAAALRNDPADVLADRLRHVERVPPEELRSPGDVGVLAIGKEALVEELAVDRDVGDHVVAVERGGRARSEDWSLAVPLSPVELAGPAA